MFFYHYPIISKEARLPIYLVSIGMHDCQPWVRRGSEYAYPQIFYCTKGKGILRIDGTETEIPAGTGFFVPASYPHEYWPVGDVWDNHWIIPGGHACEAMLAETGLDRPQTFTLGSTDMLEHFFRNMHEALQSDRIGGNLRASGYLYDFLIELDRVRNSGDMSGGSHPAVSKCVEYIDENYMNQITMDELCSTAGVSKQHLCRLFRNVLGVRPMEYIAKRRIQAAKEILSGTGTPIEEISETVGFCTPSYFCKLFKRYEGITPTQFRRS